MKKILKCITVFGCISVSALAVDEQKQATFDFGGAIRARYEFTDNWTIPATTQATGSYQDYMRFRTQVWGSMNLSDCLTAKVRLGNEFREIRKPEDNDKMRFPDELYVDEAYVEYKDENFSIKVGRQDIIKGAGRIVLDGTPGDGSRTIHFDAVSLKLNLAEKSNLELIALYNHYREELSIGRTEVGVYDMTAFAPGNPYSQLDEYGVIAYAEIREMDNLPIDLYYIWKGESDFYVKDQNYPGRNTHTIGLRAVPQLNDYLSADIEAAYQFGSVDAMDDFKSRDISAGMVFAGLTAQTKKVRFAPSMTLGLLYLSGDREHHYGTKEGNTETGWNPLFNRTAYVSEIMCMSYEPARWTNLIYPHVSMGMSPLESHRLSVECGPMYVAEKDKGADSSEKGLLTKATYTFPMGKIGGMTFNGLVAGELFHYGDYYDAEEPNATFLRFEINATF